MREFEAGEIKGHELQHGEKKADGGFQFCSERNLMALEGVAKKSQGAVNTRRWSKKI